MWFQIDLPSLIEYSQRVTDLAVTDTAQELGVKSYIVIPPTIYGKGEERVEIGDVLDVDVVPDRLALVDRDGLAFADGEA
jgi:hypothetical protein